MQVDFYHLTVRPLDRVLPQIAARVVAGGGRMLVVSEAAAQLAALDRALWTYQPESFLPHAIAGGEDDTGQPVLLSSDIAPTNGARNVALADGRWRDAALGFDRVFHLFDEATLAGARSAWRDLGARDGLERRYWKQKEGGGWERAA